MIYEDGGLTEEKATSMMKLAGFKFTHVYELVNLYWRTNSPTGSWWLFITPWGPIRLGCRKRVIEIDWTGTGTKLDLGRPEDEKWITTWDTGVHVYNIPHTIRDLIVLRDKLEAIEMAVKEKLDALDN